jgi:hypothetical protein
MTYRNILLDSILHKIGITTPMIYDTFLSRGILSTSSNFDAYLNYIFDMKMTYDTLLTGDETRSSHLLDTWLYKRIWINYCKISFSELYSTTMNINNCFSVTSSFEAAQ